MSSGRHIIIIFQLLIVIATYLCASVHGCNISMFCTTGYFTASMEEGLRLYQVNPLKLCYSVRKYP